MAKGRYEVEGVISLKDEAAKTIQKTEKGFKRLTNTIRNSTALQIAAIAGVAVAIRGLTRFIGESIEKSKEHEDALKRLETASAKYGEAAERTMNKVVDFSIALQKVSTVGDEVAISIGAFLLQMGVAPKQIEEAVQGSADLAASLGIDLLSAARNVGKTVGGFAGELGEVIPELKNLSAEALQAGEGIAFLAEKFKGAAAAEAETFAGKLKQLSNAWGDLQEGVGNAITQNEGAIGSLDSLTKSVEDATPGIAELTGGVIELAEGLVNLLKAGGDAVRGVRLFAEGTIGLDGAVKGAEISASAMKRTATSLGITVTELASRIEKAKIRNYQFQTAVDDASGSMKDATVETERLAAAQKLLDAEAAKAATAMEKLGLALGIVTAAELEAEILAIEKSMKLARDSTKGFSNELNDLEEEGSRQIESLELRIEGLARGTGDMGKEAANASLGFKTEAEALALAAEASEKLTGATIRSTSALSAAAIQAGQTAGAYGQLSALAETLALAQARNDLANIQASRGVLSSRTDASSYALSPFGTGGSYRLDADGTMRPA